MLEQQRLLESKLLIKSLLILCVSVSSVALGQETPPGTTIYQTPSEPRSVVSSTSFAILPNGDYVASHIVRKINKTGVKSNDDPSETLIHRSSDKGATWKQVSVLDRHTWGNLFVAEGKLYSIGVHNRNSGRLTIRCSGDGGATWSKLEEESGFLTSQTGFYTFHAAPMVHRQRVWVFVEKLESKLGYRTYCVSAPIGADLLKPASWKKSTAIRIESNSLGGNNDRITEGAALPAGQDVMALFRVVAANREMSAIGKVVQADANPMGLGISQFVEFPGGSNSFGAVYDSKSNAYWAVTLPKSKPYADLNRLTLVRSEDLGRWERRYRIVSHRDGVWHSLSTPSIGIDGDQLVMVTTCAWGDTGSANRPNRLVFLKVKDFRTLQLADSPPVLGKGRPFSLKHADFTVEGDGVGVSDLKEGKRILFYFANPKWKSIPPRFAGWRHIKMAPVRDCQVKVIGNRDTTIYVAIADDQGPVDMTGWQPIPEQLTFDDKSRVRSMLVFSRSIKKNETIVLPEGTWFGTTLLVPPDEN